ncbi:MAG: Fur family transcriptional regulator [Rhodobacteraceae bacterium CG17_big_fil_post_rev_8_21_14_2_50_63_15]|nr:transcriptional repressor [Roseovarius sp.]PIV78157.1 MAG: Fur family transcriptional regulator [Rhodobacteraceae bacterium CG17_big_fil_post_rev_8_21_14_2_50_63_15]
MDTIGFEQHDHKRCVQAAIAAVEAHCETHRLHLTPVRRRVLEILLNRHSALGAYEILDTLRVEGLGSQPPVVYRALDFLVSHGFAHKIERLNAFIACTHPGQDHTPAFLICRRCDAVAEAHAEPTKGMLGRAASDSGFVIEQAVVEAVGLCPRCHEGAPSCA